MKENWETILPSKSNNHINEWADYIEVYCLIKKDIASPDDILDVFSDADILEDDELNSIQGEGTRSDKYTGIIADVFAIIKYREKRVGQMYPFHIHKGSLELKDNFDIGNSVYVFLLLASSTRQVSSFQRFASIFEILCGKLIEAISFTNADNLLAGTAGNVIEGESVYDKVTRMGELIKSGTTKSFQESIRFTSPSGGDGGVDILSVKSFKDEYSYRPMILSQCTCSRDKWVDKQSDISHDKWEKRLNNIPRFVEIMWLPFSICRADGMLENPSEIRTCIMDRYRILEIISENARLIDKIEFSKEIDRELSFFGEER